MAAYTKAWIVPWDAGQIGIAYEREDGIDGFLRLDKAGHPELPKLMRLLSDADLREVETRLKNVIPFTRSQR